MNKYYLRVDGDKFGFVVDGIHEISVLDIPISNDDYNNFFEMQSQGKQFRLKNEIQGGNNLFDYVEEYTPEIIEVPYTPTETELLRADIDYLAIMTGVEL